MTWKLYISGDSEGGYQCLLRTSIETVPLLQFPEITDSWVKMRGIDKKLYISTPEEIVVVHLQKPEELDKIPSAPMALEELQSEVRAKLGWPKEKPSEASIAFAALIVDLNHNSGYFPMEYTPFDQKFSFETHKQIGGRKLDHER